MKHDLRKLPSDIFDDIKEVYPNFSLSSVSDEDLESNLRDADISVGMWTVHALSLLLKVFPRFWHDCLEEIFGRLRRRELNLRLVFPSVRSYILYELYNRSLQSYYE